MNKDELQEFQSISNAIYYIHNEEGVYNVWRSIYIESTHLKPHNASFLRQRLDARSLHIFNKTANKIVNELGY